MLKGSEYQNLRLDEIFWKKSVHFMQFRMAVLFNRLAAREFTSQIQIIFPVQNLRPNEIFCRKSQYILGYFTFLSEQIASYSCKVLL